MNHKVEYLKYLKDPCYCIEENFEVFDNTQGGYVPYKLFSQQKLLINSYLKYRHNVVAKPRQAGISTTTAAFLAVQIALASKKNPERIEILANKLSQSKEFLSKVREFLMQIPAWVWGSNYNYNKQKEGHVIGKGATTRLEFHNGSYIAAKPCTKDSLRGTTPTYLVIDEAAFVENGKETYAASAAAVATGGKIILISTPNGMDELYYAAYSGALNKENDYNIVRLHWAFDPRYNKEMTWQVKDENDDVIDEFPEEDYTEKSIRTKLDEGLFPVSPWFYQMCRDLNNDKRAIAQELLVQFKGSGGNVIDVKTIEYYKNHFVKEPEITTWEDNNMWIWKLPIPEHKYISGVDNSSGGDGDYRTMSIIDLTDYEVVAEYRGKVSDASFADLVFKYSNMYSAKTVIDITGGYSDLLIHLLQQRGFTNFFYKTVEKNGVLIEENKPGLKIQNDREAAISWFVSRVEQKSLKCFSIRQVTEWDTFIWKNGRADHQSGFNDDLITSVLMALWVAEKIYDKIEKLKNVDEVMVNSYLGTNRTSSNKKENTSRVKNLKKIYGRDYWLFK